jgi:hypothetical protein
MVAQMMSQEMCRKFSKMMLEKGLTVGISEVFREGPYVVLQMQVIKVDAFALATGQTGNDHWFFWWFMALIGAGRQQHFEEDYRESICAAFQTFRQYSVSNALG